MPTDTKYGKKVVCYDFKMAFLIRIHRTERPGYERPGGSRVVIISLAHIEHLRSEKLENVTQLVKNHRSQEKREAYVRCFWEFTALQLKKGPRSLVPPHTFLFVQVRQFSNRTACASPTNPRHFTTIAPSLA